MALPDNHFGNWRYKIWKRGSVLGVLPTFQGSGILTLRTKVEAQADANMIAKQHGRDCYAVIKFYGPKS